MKAIFNGELVDESFVIPVQSRAFFYADSTFEFFVYQNNRFLNLEEHYFNLCASMRILRMSIPDTFTQEFITENLNNLLKENHQTNNLIFKIHVFRNNEKEKSLPKQKISYWIESEKIQSDSKDDYKLDTYKDYYVNTNLYNQIHVPNPLNGFGNIYREENELDDLLLQNHDKKVARTLNGTIFLLIGNEILTPLEQDGAKRSVQRNWLINQIQKSRRFTIKEDSFHPFKLTQANLVCVLTSDYQIHFVTQFKKKQYNLEQKNEILGLLKF